MSIVRCQTKLSIFVAAEVLRWKRYVAAAARQCFENLSCKFANNCESQLCLAWERPTPPLNPILFYTVEQINRGQQLGRKQRRPPQASCPPPLMCISSSSKMRDLLVEAKSSSRPPTGAAARAADMEFVKKFTFICKIYFESQHRLHKIEMVDRKSNSTSTNSTRQHTLLRLWNSRHT